MPAEQRIPTSGTLLEDGEVKVIGDEPRNTGKIRSLQRKLYCKAKAEPAFRFYCPSMNFAISSITIMGPNSERVSKGYVRVFKRAKSGCEYMVARLRFD